MRRSSYLSLAGLVFVTGGAAAGLNVIMLQPHRQALERVPVAGPAKTAPAFQSGTTGKNEGAGEARQSAVKPAVEQRGEVTELQSEPLAADRSPGNSPRAVLETDTGPAATRDATSQAATKTGSDTGSKEAHAGSQQLGALLASPASAPGGTARNDSAPLGNAKSLVPLPTERPSALISEATASAANLFSQVSMPSPGPARVVGFYSAGCLAGAQQLPLRGRNWQVMRPSRDRYWGHPDLIRFIERLGEDVATHSDWAGILVGDMSQPRGGPLPAGHASHQIGLDVDVWLEPMPSEPYTPTETETVPMVSVVAADEKRLEKDAWHAEDATMIKMAAEDPDVERIFVNPVIKEELCRTRTASDASWLRKVRPWFGHEEHMHVRLKCPRKANECREQPPLAAGDGCGKPLNYWFKPGILATQERLRAQAPVKRTTTIRALPAECSAVLHAPAAPSQIATYEQ